MSETPGPGEAKGWRLPWWGAEAAIVLLALLVRLPFLELKPAHFDEGVNGYFADLMRTQGFYRYDPTNFHGPLHFYVLFLAQTLLGRSAWALRLPLVVTGAGAVGLVLAFRRFLPPATCRWAGLAMALSPAFIFYARYAIHETEQLAFLLLLTWGVLGLWREGDVRSLRAAAWGATGCVLTKETWVIHFLAMALAVPTLWLAQRLHRGEETAWARPQWTPRQAWTLAGLCLFTIIFFYSGCLLDFGSLPGLITALKAWVTTGTLKDGGHNKDWDYWFDLIIRYRQYPHQPMEGPLILGLAASLWLAWGARSRELRYLLITGLGTWVAYTLVPYKTPWCLISFAWPFLFAFGEGVRRLGAWLTRWGARALAMAVLGVSARAAWFLNAEDYAREEEPYAYVQTLPTISLILDPIRWRATHAPEGRLLTGYILYPPNDTHPLPWLLAEYPNIQFLAEDQAKPNLDAEVLLIENSFVTDVEERLRERYFRQELVLRGNSGVVGMLYLRASSFAPLFPGRTPEFLPYEGEEPPPAP